MKERKYTSLTIQKNLMEQINKLKTDYPDATVGSINREIIEEGIKHYRELHS